MELAIPELSLVLLVGPSGCGKSTFARRHFKPTEIVSSDHYRGVVCDDEAEQAASHHAFELVHLAIRQRLIWRKLTVVDATNLQPDVRRHLLEMARRAHYLACAVVFDLPEELCQQHNLARAGRTVPAHVVTSHVQAAQRAAVAVEREPFARRWLLRTPEEIEAATVRRVPLREDRRAEAGPFDIIGDVHGCIDELMSLLALLGYQVGHTVGGDGGPVPFAVPPFGRRAVFVGDLCDRGPDSPSVLRLVADMVRRGHAFSVLGNHDYKLLRHLRGNEVKPTHGLTGTLEQLAAHPPGLAASVRDFLEGLPTHLVLDRGRLVVAHAGLREDLQGRVGGRVQAFALYGDTTGKTDDHGLPERRNWAAEYQGRATVVYGHTPVREPIWQGQTVNIDTGCVFGGRLTALRWPEREEVSVPARSSYETHARPLLTLEMLLGHGGPTGVQYGEEADQEGEP
ncbi:MAG: AAA family ATPase [Gemmataceae bacterium]|nr:AAA family ATPase [Gemmataceae bacterium]